MTEHQYEVRCACGARWRVLLEDDDHPMSTCLNCGAYPAGEGPKVLVAARGTAFNATRVGGDGERMTAELASVVVPSDLTWKALNTAHRWVLRLTGGRVGWRAAGMPVLELSTIGRKSGKPRSVMLPSPVQEGETWVVVASRGGDVHHPAWFLNLRDHPDVEVSRQGEPKRSMRARIATDQERALLWPQVTATYGGYARYQEKTDREIPLVLLEPQN